MITPQYQSSNIILAAPTTTVVCTGACTLHSIVINKSLASGVIAIYDGLTAGGVLLGTITRPATLLSDAVQTVIYDIHCATGICIVTSGAAQDITVTYTK